MVPRLILIMVHHSPKDTKPLNYYPMFFTALNKMTKIDAIGYLMIKIVKQKFQEPYAGENYSQFFSN